MVRIRVRVRVRVMIRVRVSVRVRVSMGSRFDLHLQAGCREFGFALAPGSLSGSGSTAGGWGRMPPRSCIAIRSKSEPFGGAISSLTISLNLTSNLDLNLDPDTNPNLVPSLILCLSCGARVRVFGCPVHNSS